MRVVGEQKEMLGVMSLLEALDMADELDVDVVMINPQADPPVVRLVDYSKFRYEQTRAKKEANKKQREARCAICIIIISIHVFQPLWAAQTPGHHEMGQLLHCSLYRDTH